MKYVCKCCGLIYDEERGNSDLDIDPGTPFDKIPDDFECPYCFSSKEAFIKYDE